MKQLDPKDIKRAAPEGTADNLERLLAELHEAMQTDAEQTRNRYAEVIEELPHLKKGSASHRWIRRGLSREVIEAIRNLEANR